MNSMPVNNSYRTGITFLLLVGLRLISEAHHFFSPMHLPDATLAVYFLAGRYIRQYWSWPALFLVGLASDYSMIHYRGVSNFCFTSAYTFLVFAYGAMWYAGRLTRDRRIDRLGDLGQLAGAAAIATAIAFLISNGSFYWLSGRYPDTTVGGYIANAATYLPRYMATPWFWLGVAAVIEFCLLQWRALARRSASDS